MKKDKALKNEKTCDTFNRVHVQRNVVCCVSPGCIAVINKHKEAEAVAAVDNVLEKYGSMLSPLSFDAVLAYIKMKYMSHFQG